MEDNKNIVPFQKGNQITKVAHSLKITNKLFTKADEKLIPYRKKDKWGFCTINKKIVIDCEFDKVSRFTEGLAKVKRNGKWGFVNSTGNIIISIVYDDVNSFNEGFAAVFKSENGWSFIDTNSNAIFSNFDYITDFNDGIAPILIKKRIIYIDKNGSQINSLKSVPFDRSPGGVEMGNRDLSKCYKFSEGLVLAFFGSHFGFYDKNGNMKIPLIYDQADSFSNGVAQVGSNYGGDRNHAKAGYIDHSGNFVIPQKYLFVYRNGYHFSEELELVMKGYHKDYGYLVADRFFINKKDDVIIPPTEYDENGYRKYLYISNFSDGRALVSKNFRHGFIDINGNLIIGCDFEKASPFSEGLSRVRSNSKYGFIDRYGNFVIDSKYGGIPEENFHDGLCLVSDHGLEGYIDKNGVEYWED